jgi:ribosomal protein S18 acetylase RimI-like enzyme
VAYLRRTQAWKPADAWTLEFVGVLPQARGKGLARHLCERAQADHPEAPAFLTTADPDNVGLYERWGFDAFVRTRLTGITVVGMIRPVPIHKEHTP